ncbi:MAG TPA: hypothetical protein VFJ12_09010 [Segeticoccus sp.]|nr:hypothetical protein [Segeticoccus sp.]
MFSIGHAVFEENATIDKNSDVGGAGFAIHAMDGEMLIPLLALVLLVVALVARFEGAVKWAAIILADVAVQIGLAVVPGPAGLMGTLHGLSALVLFTASAYASYVVSRAPAAAPVTAPLPATSTGLAGEGGLGGGAHLR